MILALDSLHLHCSSRVDPSSQVHCFACGLYRTLVVVSRLDPSQNKLLAISLVANAFSNFHVNASVLRLDLSVPAKPLTHLFVQQCHRVEASLCNMKGRFPSKNMQYYFSSLSTVVEQ